VKFYLEIDVDTATNTYGEIANALDGVAALFDQDPTKPLALERPHVIDNGSNDVIGQWHIG
jgi:hypothetical protein